MTGSSRAPPTVIDSSNQFPVVMVGRYALSLAIGVGLTLAVLAGLAVGVTLASIPPPPPDDEPLIRTDHGFFERSVDVGEETTIGIRLTNVGGVDTIATYSLSMNGQHIGERELLLRSEQTRQFSFTLQPAARGSYRLNHSLSYDGKTLNGSRGLLLVGEPEPETLIGRARGREHSSQRNDRVLGCCHVPPVRGLSAGRRRIAMTAADPTIASTSPPEGTWDDGLVQAESPGRTKLLVEYRRRGRTRRHSSWGPTLSH
ncbi:MAG: hypothetical protein U5K37_08495 [Natrialbaceae archaeon]|nr:hypothetical protein [Natrialbaceae archaeon]